MSQAFKTPVPHELETLSVRTRRGHFELTVWCCHIQRCLGADTANGDQWEVRGRNCFVSPAGEICWRAQT